MSGSAIIQKPGIEGHFEAEPLGLYVHVPFCSTTCDFCAFHQTRPDRLSVHSYLEGIGREANSWGEGLGKEVSTVFWGGGTPGILGPDDLGRLAEAIRPLTGNREIQEWTVEMAPASTSPAKLRALKEAGVDRISLGIQSFDERFLRAMKREHSAGQVLRAYDWIRSEGFSHVNVDMIIAFPGQTTRDLLSDLEQATALGPDHLSAYCLTFEEDTALYARLMEGLHRRDIEQESAFYEETWSFLGSQGLAQYEVSNFAKKGHQSRHNLNTWRMAEWIGLGPSASSQFGGLRSTHAHDLETWLGDLRTGSLRARERVELYPDDLLADCLIFGLRMVGGVSVDELESRFGEDCLTPWKVLFGRLVEEGLAQYSEGGQRFSLTLSGRLVADAIGVEVLSRDGPLDRIKCQSES